MAAVVLANSPQGIQPTRDSYSECALAVQHETGIAVEAIKSRGIMSRSEWANPLTAAPSAVCIMAILLKTASSTVAAGMPLENRAVKDSKGKTIGELQSKLLHSNLQACTDLGRNAFSEARDTMNYLNRIALHMTQNKGKIENILKMIEPSNDEDEDEDVRVDLRDQMKDIRTSTSKCLERIQKLTDDFYYWYWVICTIKENVLEGKGEIQDKANRNKDNLNKVKIENTEQSKVEAITLKSIEELKDELKDAKNKVKDAEMWVEKLVNLPLIPEPSMEKESLRAEKAIPAAKRKVGLLGKVKEKIKGENSEQFAAREAYLRDIESRRNEYMEREKRKRDEVREEAERTLKRAREYEESLRASIRKYQEELNENRKRLADVKANLEMTESQFKQLSNTEVELADILTILQTSAHQLGKLKEHVQQLSTFLTGILDDVTVTVENDLESEFLRPIERGIRVDLESQFKEVKLNKQMQGRVRDSALRIQASFCAIRDISCVFVTISDRYITKAINQMESLSCLQGKEWENGREDFFEWCNKSIEEIKGLTETVTEKLEENMKERVARLAQLVIEPAH